MARVRFKWQKEFEQRVKNNSVLDNVLLFDEIMTSDRNYDGDLTNRGYWKREFLIEYFKQKFSPV